MEIFPSRNRKSIDLAELPSGPPTPTCRHGPLAPGDKSTQILPNGKVVVIKWKILSDEVKEVEQHALKKVFSVLGKDCQILVRGANGNGVIGLAGAGGSEEIRLAELPPGACAQVVEILEFYSSTEEGGANMLPSKKF